MMTRTLMVSQATKALWKEEPAALHEKSRPGRWDENLRRPVLTTEAIANAMGIESVLIRNARVSRKGDEVFHPDRVAGRTHLWTFFSAVRIRFSVETVAWMDPKDRQNTWAVLNDDYLSDAVKHRLFFPDTWGDPEDRDVVARGYIKGDEIRWGLCAQCNLGDLPNGLPSWTKSAAFFQYPLTVRAIDLYHKIKRNLN